MKTRKILFVVATVIFLTSVGCATSRLKVKNATLPYGQKEINLLLEPWQTCGLKVTEAMKRGEVTVFYGVFNPILFAEWQPGRTTWYGWAISENGEEFFAQAIFSGINRAGTFVVIVVIDGKGPKVDNAKIVLLSTMLDFAYDMGGNEYPIEWKKFVQNVKGYRTALVQEKGTRIGDMRKARGFFRVVKQWTRYEKRDNKDYVIYSPLTAEKMRAVEKINPQYTFSQKLIGSARFVVIPLDPVATALENALDVYRVYRLPSAGWDYRSKIPNLRDVGLILKFATELQNRLIHELRNELLERELEGRRE